MNPQPLQQPLKIKALRGLHLAVGNNHMLRLLEVLYTIKALWVDCPMRSNEANRLKIAEALGVCEKTVCRQIDELMVHDLVRSRGAGTGLYDAIGWDELCDRYNIKHKKHYIIDFIPLGEKGRRLRLWHILYCKVKKEKKETCSNALYNRIKRNTYVKQVLDEVAGTDHARYFAQYAEAVANHQLLNFLTEGLLYDEDARYMLSTYFTKRTDKILRGDLEMNYRTWTATHGYSGDGSLANMDRKCQRLGLLTIEHRQKQLPGHNSRASRRNNRQGFTKYDSATGQLWLIQCDKRTVLPLKGLQERIQASNAEAEAVTTLIGPGKPASASRRSQWLAKSWETKKAKQHAKAA